jgi:hypothetical protein
MHAALTLRALRLERVEQREERGAWPRARSIIACTFDPGTRQISPSATPSSAVVFVQT